MGVPATGVEVRPGERIAGRFHVIASAGAGGMGTVFRAEDLIDGTPVALKLVTPETRADAERVMREARVLSQITHPAVAGYHAHGLLPDGRLYLAMQWLGGTSLAHRIDQSRLSVSDTVAIGKRLAAALGATHALGIVHRDVKPPNVMLLDGRAERATLVDFGVAHMRPSIHNVTALTRTGVMIGTPSYIAPEQARGNRIDGRADWFALGCVLFECLTARPVFSAKTVMALLARVLFDPAPEVRALRPDVPQSLSSLIGWLLQKDPAARPTKADEVLEALQKLSRGSDDTSPFGDTITFGDTGAFGDRGAPRQAPMWRLTPREQRVVTMVAATWRGRPPSAQARGRLNDLAQHHQARLAVLSDGSLIALLERGETPVDQALQAARLALAIRTQRSGAAIAVVLGRSLVTQNQPLGEAPLSEAVDKVGEAVRLASPDMILIDEACERLLSSRFRITREKGHFVLHDRQDSLTESKATDGRAPCVGRRRELALLASTLEESIEEASPRVVVITAEAGMGKSRLAEAFVEQLTRRAIHDKADALACEVSVAQGEPIQAAAPFGMLKGALRRCIAGDHDASDADSSIAADRFRKTLERHAAPDEARRIATFLEQIAGVRSNPAPYAPLQAAQADPALMHEHMVRAFTDWLAARCKDQPQLWILEDLHFGDPSTVTLFDRALSQLGNAPLMLLVLARPNVHELHPDLFANHEVTQLKLGKLSRKAAGQLVAHGLGASASEATVGAVVQRANGHAFFLQELTRAAAETAVGRDFDKGFDDSLSRAMSSVPDTVLGLVESRLMQLVPEARLVLRAASIFGGTFRQAGVAAQLGTSAPEDLADWFATLQAQEWIAPRLAPEESQASEFMFRHDLVRQACYGMLPEDDRIMAHRAVGEWLEAEWLNAEELAAQGLQGHDSASPALLGKHFERGGEGQRAANHYLRAAEQALQGNDLSGAVRFAEHGRTLGPDPGTRGELHRIQAEGLIWQGEPSAARAHAEQALAQIGVESLSWPASLASFAEASAMLGHDQDVREPLEQLLRVTDRNGSWQRARVSALARISFSKMLLGDAEATRHVLDAALSAAEGHAIDDPLVRGHLAQAEAAHAMMDHDRERAAEQYELASNAFAEVGAERLASGACTNQGAMFIELGAYRRAEALCLGALRRAEQAGSAYAAALARLNAGIAASHLGRLSEGITNASLAITAFRNQGEVRLEASALCARADILLRQEQAERAESDARDALVASAELAPSRAAAAAMLAHVLLERGKMAEALRVAETGMEARDHTAMEEREVLLRSTYGQALARAGRTRQSQRVLVALGKDIAAEAQTLRDPALRQSFLTQVPEVAAALRALEHNAPRIADLIRTAEPTRTAEPRP